MVKYTIGRGADNDIIMDEPSISRLHAELIAEPDGRYRVKDLGSSNGTHIQHDGGWEKLDDAEVEIETGTTIRLGQSVTSVADLLDLREEISGGDPYGAPEGQYAASTDTNREPYRTAEYDHAPSAQHARPASNLARPAVAIGGATALVLVVMLFLLMGPLGGAGRTDFVEACTIRSGSRVTCQCWGTALRPVFSKQEFDMITAAIVKRDFLTALTPNLRAKFTRIRDINQAKCGPLAT